jgi:hypothetical protein
VQRKAGKTQETPIITISSIGYFLTPPMKDPWPAELAEISGLLVNVLHISGRVHHTL